MEKNKTVYKYDPCCLIFSIADFTTTDNYEPAFIFDTSKHPSFALQLINKHATNALTYKIETTFDGINFSEIKADTDITSETNTIFEDESIGTKTIVYVKSKVSSTPATFNLFLRLKPASFIV